MSTAPGSSAPPAYCQMHHIDRWESGGMTDIDGLTLADHVMHGRIDDDRADENRWWTVRVRPEDVPEARKAARSRAPAPSTPPAAANPKVKWIPPKSRDPNRMPRENHHPLGWLAPGRRIRRFFARNDDEPPGANASHGGGRDDGGE